MARAQLVAAGEGALLSHGTAAWRWHIIPAPPSMITLAVPRRRTVGGLKLHVSGRYRAHLRKGQRIRLRVIVTDQARNRATKIVTIRLR